MGKRKIYPMEVAIVFAIIVSVFLWSYAAYRGAQTRIVGVCETTDNQTRCWNERVRK